ncbi:hypothetical protein PAHAL_9G068000 [Panicum hallii]|uniref:Uncharacterized protein n=1 Tax=Panicum hallii TaxID=206008 RepID=A0A2T8I0L2_9POAL|nr:hypothetical protein PAHAL_9G068000 [Panicum hallii]
MHDRLMKCRVEATGGTISITMQTVPPPRVRSLLGLRHQQLGVAHRPRPRSARRLPCSISFPVHTAAPRLPCFYIPYKPRRSGRLRVPPGTIPPPARRNRQGPSRQPSRWGPPRRRCCPRSGAGRRRGEGRCAAGGGAAARRREGGGPRRRRRPGGWRRWRRP